LEEKPEAPKSTLISTACYIFTKDDLAMIKEYLAVRKTPDVIGFCGFAQIYRRENQQFAQFIYQHCMVAYHRRILYQ
jgi:hypothetical protein